MVTISESMLEFWNFNKEKRTNKVGYHSDALCLACCKLVDVNDKPRLLTGENSKILRIYNNKM